MIRMFKVRVSDVGAGVVHHKGAADTINVDQVLYQSGGVADANLLSGTVNMSLAGNVLTIILRNTSQNGAGDGAGILLTGIGFQLPTGVSITGGSAVIGSGSTAVNFAGTNVPRSGASTPIRSRVEISIRDRRPAVLQQRRRFDGFYYDRSVCAWLARQFA